MLDSFDIELEAHIKREKAKAKRLRRTRWWLQKRAAAHCFYCHASLLPEQVTMDHVVALSRGGRSTKSNITTACHNCNRAKKDHHIVDYLLSCNKSALR